MNNQSRRTVAGVEFEAVRFMSPAPHWRPRVVKTGYVFDVGVFKNDSRPHMWESMEYMAHRIGCERFAREATEAA